ncbi:hypothetical protein NGA_0462400, partial [Nannochloropsis gaditana CCMP526]|uniref:uncharacterized protein n=1 Tax=Nannochloropsis gaditana (strain CCMP526) TaxID=1093141 RepID=UPI00029F7EB6
PAPPAQILGVKGRGVFSSVLVAHDTQAVPTSPLGPSPRTVAIKVLRGNDLMLQAGLKEAALLRALTEGDKRDEGHVVRFHEEFRLGGHVCVVMEAMHLNLRKLLKTYGPSQGLAIKAVLSYAQQLLVGLAYLEQQGVAHADLKPDNLVVDTSMSVLKICDFGSALHTHELEGNEAEEAATSTPYLQSRFYRAPEVILGYPPRGPAMDMWSAGTTMYELYTARVLFPGRHNNEVLRQMMEVRGPFSRKLLKKASPGLRSQHFDEEGMFLARELDKGSQVESVRALPPPTGPSRQLGEMLCSPKIMARMPSQTRQQVELLRGFLEQALVLDPAKRARPVQALQLFKGRGSGGKK